MEYYKNGELKYKGDFLNNEKNGFGFEYDDKGILLFEGEYLNGQRKEK